MEVLGVPEMCFWPAKLEKNLNFWRCIHVIDLVPKYGSDINEGNFIQLLFYFLCIDGFSCIRYWNEFFSTVFQVLDWVFLVLHFDGNICNWIPKVIWPRMDWFWVLFGKWLLLLTSFLYGLKSARIAQLLFSIDGVTFSRCLVWGVFCSVL